jgi:hypothetical protein
MSAYSALIAAIEQMSPDFVCEISGGRAGTPQWNAAPRALTALSLSLSLSLSTHPSPGAISVIVHARSSLSH